jgi:hypothetical protein
VRISPDLIDQIPANCVEVAHSKVEGDLDAASSRLHIEGVRHFSVMTTYVRGEENHVFRILVPPNCVEAAREIIELVNSGAFELRDDELPPG